MLYDEFVKGTGCKQNDYNYKVYKELEIIYMNTDCTKEHIYEMGKKLVDNSKTEKELEFEANVKSQIEHHKAEIKFYKTYLDDDTTALKNFKGWGSESTIQYYRNNIKCWKQKIKEEREIIRSLKWIINA